MTLESLFDLSYIRKPVSPVQWALLVVYTPFGVVLAVARILLTVVLCLYAIGTKKFLPAITLTDRTYAAALGGPRPPGRPATTTTVANGAAGGTGYAFGAGAA